MKTKTDRVIEDLDSLIDGRGNDSLGQVLTAARDLIKKQRRLLMANSELIKKSRRERK